LVNSVPLNALSVLPKGGKGYVDMIEKYNFYNEL